MKEPLAIPDDRLTDVDEFDLRRAMTALRRGWPIVLACAVAAAVLQAISLHGARPVYRVEMEVAAVQGPVADVGSGADDHEPDHRGGHDADRSFVTPLYFTLYLESLRTRDVADELAKDPQIASSLPSRSSGRLVDGARIQKYLQGQLSVNQDQRKHTFSILRLDSSQPDAAQHLLLALHQAADAHMRTVALARSRQMIAGLGAEPGAAANPAISQLLAEQQRIQAVALSSAPFAAQVIGGPATDPKPLNRPMRSLLSALIAGAAVGAAVALLLEQLVLGRRRTIEAETR